MINHKPIHAPLAQFAVIDDCLHIGGVPLTQLAQRVGKTPFFAYERRALTARVQYLRQHLPHEIGLHYSIKANPMPALVQHMAGLVDGFDIASSGELKVVLDTSMRPAAISFAGPAKTEGDLTRAIAAGIVINIESHSELEAIARIGTSLAIRPSISVRVNPDFELKSSGMKMGGGAKQFGIDADQIPQLLHRVDALRLNFQGFQIYSGSQSLKATSIMEAQSNTFELAFRLAKNTRQATRMLNIGGGFGIPYFPGDTPIDLQAIGMHLKQWIPRIKAELPDAKIVIELGRYLVGEAGIYVTRIIDRKISRGQVFLITDGGMNHQLAASGNLGQVIRKNYPVAVGNKMHGQTREVVSVVGPLCTPLDIMADTLEMAYAEVGDLIVVFQSGAYAYTASPIGFLSHPLPDEVLV